MERERRHARGRGPPTGWRNTSPSRGGSSRCPSRNGERLREAVDPVPTGSLARAAGGCPANAAGESLRDAIDAAARRARVSGARRRARRGPPGERSRSPPRSCTRRSRTSTPARRRTHVEIDYEATDEADAVDDRRRRPAASSPPTAPGVEDGHLGLTVMRKRARGYGGKCEFTSDARLRNERDPMASPLEQRLSQPDACPHVAMLLSHREQILPLRASFYALGAKRNGWLFHRTNARPRRRGPRRAPPRQASTSSGIEAEGRMVFSEIEFGDQRGGLGPRLGTGARQRLARGFDAHCVGTVPDRPGGGDHRALGGLRRGLDTPTSTTGLAFLCACSSWATWSGTRGAAMLAETHDTVLS